MGLAASLFFFLAADLLVVLPALGGAENVNAICLLVGLDFLVISNARPITFNRRIRSRGRLLPDLIRLIARLRAGAYDENLSL